MMRSLLLLCAACTVTACGADLVAPHRLTSAQALSARAPNDVSLGSWPSSASTIGLSWNDNSRNEGGWEVHRSTTGATGSFTLRTSLPANATGHDDSGLGAATEYCYRVRSFRRQGPNNVFDGFSNVSCSTTFAPPAAPSGLDAMPPSSGEVRVTWSDNATTETAFRLERSATADGPWATAANLGVNATTFSESRPAEQLVCYRVIAINTWGASAPSNVDCTAPPTWPRDVVAVSANASSIDVTWTDASSVEDGYEVQRATDDLAFSVVGTAPANATSYHDAGIVPETRYWYRVRSKKDGGFSYFSATASAAAASRAPDAPAMWGASPAGSSWVQVGFSVSVTTTTVRVERSTDGQATWATAATQNVSDGTYYYDGDRAPEAMVCYRVFAANALGESPASGVDCTTPPAAPTNLWVTDNGDGTWTATWTDNSSVEESYDVYTTYCDWWDCYWNVYSIPANSTTITLTSADTFQQLYAVYDGGYSDPASWGGAPEGLSAMKLAPVKRPAKGTRAPRPATARSFPKP